MKEKIDKYETKLMGWEIEGHPILRTKKESVPICPHCKQLILKERYIETIYQFADLEKL